MSVFGRFVPPLLMLLAACTIVAPRGAVPPNDTSLLLHEARAAYERGDDAVSIVRAEAFIASAPGHPLLGEAQLLLARIRERSGAWATAWEQYRLFLSNYPTHAEAADALEEAIAGRIRRGDAIPEPSRPRRGEHVILAGLAARGRGRLAG